MGRVDVTVIDHPLAAERLTILRDASTPNAEFRAALDGLAGMLVYEATREPARRADRGHDAGRSGRRPPAVHACRCSCPSSAPASASWTARCACCPAAEVGFIGLARDEETFLPHPYLAKLPDRLDDRPCFVLDPMLATGGSLEYTCRLLVDRGAPQPIIVVCVLAAPEGLERIERVGHRHAGHHRAPSTATSTTRPTSSPASATPATASSGCGSHLGTGRAGGGGAGAEAPPEPPPAARSGSAGRPPTRWVPAAGRPRTNSPRNLRFRGERAASALSQVRTARTRRCSVSVGARPRRPKIEVMCFSTAPSDTTRACAMPAFERPSAMRASTSRSRGVSESSGPERRRASSCATTSGSRTVPPTRRDGRRRRSRPRRPLAP